MTCPRYSKCRQINKLSREISPYELLAEKQEFFYALPAQVISCYLCLMKFGIYSSRYFIGIGIFILLSFTGLGLFISHKLNAQTERISTDMATKVYQLKSNIMKAEFEGFITGLNNAELLIRNTNSRQELLGEKKLLEAQLLSHPEINTVWYTVLTGRDTANRFIHKQGAKYFYPSMKAYQKNWADSLMQRGDFRKIRSKLIQVADSLHWLISSRYKLADSSWVVLGLDINIKELQRYLWSVDTIGRASAFVTDEQGYYVTGPEEQLIGTKLSGLLTPRSGKIRLADSLSTYEFTNSSYLQLPVLRYYTPLIIAGMNWTMVIDTPLFVVDEDVKVIEDYVFYLLASAALIILFLIAWSQSKWQKEFMLRQQAELKRRELLAETQVLNLVAERQQKENALLQLNALKQKVNPHFLFNSLSSLNALIVQDPELAKSFVVKLSRVYRYVLESYPNGLATVEEELLFLKEYFFLLKIRFGDALHPLDLDISADLQRCSIPFMSLQTLIENAVKHNVLSKTRPLQIKIQNLGDVIVVSNNLQLRNDVSDSGKQGLNYLKSTYAFFGNNALKFGIEGSYYKCYLPVLKVTES